MTGVRIAVTLGGTGYWWARDMRAPPGGDGDALYADLGGGHTWGDVLRSH